MVDFVYRRLKEPSKQAFLDILFFLYDWERSKVGDIVGERELSDLAALITTSKESTVNIHAIVRAWGRKRSEGNRITDTRSWFILLRDEQKLEQTKGIWLPDYYDKLNLEAKHLDIMSRSLRVLSLGGGTILNGPCKRVFEDLRFLHISCEDILPIDLSKSRQLAFFHGHFIKGDRISKAKFTINLPESLRLLYLDAPWDSPVSLDINGHLSLRELELCNIAFENFETSIRLGNFSCLKMKLHDYSKLLMRLPESFASLSSLQCFSMNNYLKLERLPESFGNLSSLQSLEMSYCSMLERLPESFGNLYSLQTLQLHILSKLERLPQSFGNLSSLRYLNMSGCSMLPETFGNLSSLQSLEMSSCSMLKTLPESFGNLSSLQTLRMDDLSMLERLPESFGNLSSLQKLDIYDILSCSRLERLPQTFHQLSCLQSLVMIGCKKMFSLSNNFGQLKSLKFLCISNCKELKKLSEDVVYSTSLAAIRAYGCAELEAKTMDSLVDIKSLMFLEMGESPMLIKRWEEIQQHRPLIGAAISFELHNYPYLEIMSPMFFNGGSRFLHVNDDGQLASSSFPEVGVKVGLLLTACYISNELRQKLLEIASPEFQIIHVDVDMEGEADEERDDRIRETLLQLPEGSRAWTSPFHKTRLLFAYSLWRFTGSAVDMYNPSKHVVDTSIVGTNVVVDEKGRRKLSHPLEMILRRNGCDSRRVDFRTLFSPLSEALEWMIGR